MNDHVALNLGNLVVVGGISMFSLLVGMVAVHKLSRIDVPVLSPAARGVVDLTKKVAA